MTDLPRRSFPLVVPPPGGFEDAVRRGRRRRRKQAGGSTGVALVFVGALAYSLVGHGASTNSLDPANDPRIGDSRPLPGRASAAPLPEATTPTDTSPGSGGQAVGSGPRGTGPSSVPSVAVSKPPARRPQGPAVRQYAARPEIVATQDQTNTSTSCLPAQSQDWCTTADVVVSGGAQPTYTFTYTVCRSVRAEAANLHFDRTQQADFAAVDIAHNDTVWTWSAGQPVKKADTAMRFEPGECTFWRTVWDGYDDFHYTPDAGTYKLIARSFARETLPAASPVTFEHA